MVGGQVLWQCASLQHPRPLPQESVMTNRLNHSLRAHPCFWGRTFPDQTLAFCTFWSGPITAFWVSLILFLSGCCFRKFQLGNIFKVETFYARSTAQVGHTDMSRCDSRHPRCHNTNHAGRITWMQLCSKPSLSMWAWHPAFPLVLVI